MAFQDPLLLLLPTSAGNSSSSSPHMVVHNLLLLNMCSTVYGPPGSLTPLLTSAFMWSVHFNRWAA